MVAGVHPHLNMRQRDLGKVARPMVSKGWNIKNFRTCVCRRDNWNTGIVLLPLFFVVRHWWNQNSLIHVRCIVTSAIFFARWITKWYWQWCRLLIWSQEIHWESLQAIQICWSEGHRLIVSKNDQRRNDQPPTCSLISQLFDLEPANGNVDDISELIAYETEYASLV